MLLFVCFVVMRPERAEQLPAKLTTRRVRNRAELNDTSPVRFAGPSKGTNVPLDLSDFVYLWVISVASSSWHHAAIMARLPRAKSRLNTSKLVMGRKNWSEEDPLAKDGAKAECSPSPICICLWITPSCCREGV